MFGGQQLDGENIMHKSVLTIAGLVLGFSGVATADTVESNEKPCFSSGIIVPCNGRDGEKTQAEKLETRADRIRQGKLEKCLRIVDGTGQPSYSECQSLYGQ